MRRAETVWGLVGWKACSQLRRGDRSCVPSRRGASLPTATGRLYAQLEEAHIEDCIPCQRGSAACGMEDVICTAGMTAMQALASAVRRFTRVAEV